LLKSTTHQQLHGWNYCRWRLWSSRRNDESEGSM